MELGRIQRIQRTQRKLHGTGAVVGPATSARAVVYFVIAEEAITITVYGRQRAGDIKGNSCIFLCVLCILCVLRAYFFGSNSSARPFMQYRRPVGSGPSGNTCPR